MQRTIYIGFDPRQADAYAVSRESIKLNLRAGSDIEVRGLVLEHLIRDGFYWRQHESRDGRLWDVLSEAPMATYFAISRFLTPYLARRGQALFVDGDVLARANIEELFESADPNYAVQVVKHQHIPTTAYKMDNQIQTSYLRKNWSSVMLFNCEHRAISALSPEAVNAMRGLDLHQFSWLDSSLIGELDPTWNFLVDISPPIEQPKLVHFTSGVPSTPGYFDIPFAAEWRDMLEHWAS